MAKRIGILTAGSDCPGLNAAIRAIGKTAQIGFGMEVIAFQDGFNGLIYNQVIQPGLSGILTAGGTILGTGRETPNAMPIDGKLIDLTDKAVTNYHANQLDALVCIGGVETQASALQLAQQGLNIITLPKGIDNCLVETDRAIGFDTALCIATEAIDRLHSTASSHNRVIIVEIMGRKSGWLTLGAGIAGGADVILIPEIPYDVMKISKAILERTSSGKRFSIVAVSEGAISRDTVEFFERSKKSSRLTHDDQENAEVEQRLSSIENNLTGNTTYLANRLETFTGLESRITILGYLLGGGSPSASDRILATNLGTEAVKLIDQGVFGMMVASHHGDARPVPLEKVVNRYKQVPLHHAWVENARNIGVQLGD